MQLSGRVAIVTGGACGIGRAAALLFAREGAAVAVADLKIDEGESVVAEITRGGGRAIFLSGDVSKSHDCRELVESTSAAFGRVDILFNNAGIIRRATILDLPEEDWDRVMTVNVKSIYLLSRAVIPHMLKAGGGSIINTASGWGLAGGAKAAVYCASKGAVVLLTKSMALDHGPQKIRVNCVCPGDTDTEMLRDEARQLGEDALTFVAQSASRPLGRMGTPDDVAQAVLYLASDASSFVTGTALVVDGGGLAGN